MKAIGEQKDASFTLSSVKSFFDKTKGRDIEKNPYFLKMLFNSISKDKKTINRKELDDVLQDFGLLREVQSGEEFITRTAGDSEAKFITYE